MTIKIRIVGCGCDSCERLERNVKTATNLVEGNYEYSQVCDYSTKMTPILFINDELVSSGQVLSVDDLRIILSNLKEKKR